MATVIDALLVSLSLEPSGFKKGQKDAHDALKKTGDRAERVNKDMEAGAKKAAYAFAKVRNEVLGLIGAFLGVSAVKSFVETITTGDASLGRLATNVDMTTIDLSAFEGATRRTGGTAEGMAASIQSLSMEMQKLWTMGNNDLNPTLIMSGINMAKFNNRATSMTERLLMLADAFGKMNPAKAQLFGSRLGLDSGTITFLEQGRTAVERLIATQKRLNVLSERDKKLAYERKIAWLNLTDRFTSLGRVLLNTLSPVVVKLLNDFVSWLSQKDHVDAMTKAVKGFADELRNTDWKKVGADLKTVGDAFMLIAHGITEAVAGYKGFVGLFDPKKDPSMLEEQSPDPNDKGAAAFRKGGNKRWADWLENAYSKIGLGNSYDEQVRLANIRNYFTRNVALPGALSGSSTSNTNSSTVSFNGPIIIQTQATDAKGISADMRGALNKEFGIAQQANSGLQ